MNQSPAIKSSRSGRPVKAKAKPKQIAAAAAAKVKFREYQKSIFLDRATGMLILHWARQIGKSFTLASWAVDRLLSQLQKHDSWLITVLSNSKDNGAEFVIKCQEVCTKMGLVMESEDLSPDIRYENMRMEVRVTINGKLGRIKVLAANPRTARGFSGDLILDEFAFHEDSNAIWEAAEPILSGNQEFLCRIASTGNGKHNMFYRLAAGSGPNDGRIFKSAAGFAVSRVSRSEAFRMGVPIYDPGTRDSITPDDALRRALDKRAYLQNYECQFTDENAALLTRELISAATREGVGIDEQTWSEASLKRIAQATGIVVAGWDIGRNRDLSVICVLEKIGNQYRVLAMLRMAAMRKPLQDVEFDRLMRLNVVRRIEIDMTGLGVGWVDDGQARWGSYRVRGVNFATTEPVSERMRFDGKRGETARVTEIMASNLLGVFEDRCIEIPLDAELADDLRKPEKITSPGGRVSIAATRDDAGHADHFWALALAIRAAGAGGKVSYARVPGALAFSGYSIGRPSREVHL